MRRMLRMRSMEIIMIMLKIWLDIQRESLLEALLKPWESGKLLLLLFLMAHASNRSLDHLDLVMERVIGRRRSLLVFIFHLQKPI